VVRMGMSREVSHMPARREVPHMGTRREAARMDTSREVAHMAASRDLVRSRHQPVVAERRQRPEPRNLAHKMRRESQLFRQICK
jgi:hypothetical protein